MVDSTVQLSVCLSDCLSVCRQVVNMIRTFNFAIMRGQRPNQRTWWRHLTNLPVQPRLWPTLQAGLIAGRGMCPCVCVENCSGSGNRYVSNWQLVIVMSRKWPEDSSFIIVACLINKLCDVWANWEPLDSLSKVKVHIGAQRWVANIKETYCIYRFINVIFLINGSLRWTLPLNEEQKYRRIAVVDILLGISKG